MKCGECVTILGCNSPRWFVTLIGTIFAGGVGCGIYPTNSALACHLILNDCRSRFIFVDTKVQLEKLIECRHTSKIDTIVQYGESTIENNYGGLVINVITILIQRGFLFVIYSYYIILFHCM